MKTELFTFAQIYEENLPISIHANMIRREILKIFPAAKVPKLHNHITVLPPVFAPTDEMKFVVATLAMVDGLYGDVRKECNKAKISGMIFFRNPGNDALVLTLEISDSYKKIIETVRKEIKKFSHWKFEPLGEEYNPHICVAEGEGLYDALDPHLTQLENLIDPISFYLQLWQVMMKVGVGDASYWEKFDFKK